MSILMISVNKRYFFLFFFIFISCKEKVSTFLLKGYTQGTTYTIKYHTEKNIISQTSIDSLLRILDMSMSTYINNSTISKINNNLDVELDSLIYYVLNKSIEFCDKTNGMFDVTVFPIVEDWGFGPKKRFKPPTINDTTLYQIGCDQILLKRNKLIKPELVKIDLNGIAQGFTVDYLADYLHKYGIQDFMIEVGGEVVCAGNNLGNGWRIAIESPTQKKRSFAYVLKLSDIALSTSGSYRNYYYSDSTKISHTINPKTLKPANNEILSVTILASDCIKADAYATACMSFGLKEAKNFIENNNIIGSFIYVNAEDTLYYFSEEFSSFLHSSFEEAPQ